MFLEVSSIRRRRVDQIDCMMMSYINE